MPTVNVTSVTLPKVIVERLKREVSMSAVIANVVRRYIHEGMPGFAPCVDRRRGRKRGVRSKPIEVTLPLSVYADVARAAESMGVSEKCIIRNALLYYFGDGKASINSNNIKVLINMFMRDLVMTARGSVIYVTPRRLNTYLKNVGFCMGGKSWHKVMRLLRNAERTGWVSEVMMGGSGAKKPRHGFLIVVKDRNGNLTDIAKSALQGKFIEYLEGLNNKK